MSAYYNEFDEYAAQWLRNLIAAGHIAPGDVDTRSIKDVKPDDLAGYTQCHFFAGIGGWSLALRLAGWPDNRPVWTGSCPCQPFSVAGRGDGMSDERHLWPHWYYLIGQRRPPAVFGEQVEAAIRHGWLDLVQTDMEGLGYAFAASGLPAACVGASHIRQRLWFVADAEGQRRGETRSIGGGQAQRTSDGRTTSDMGYTSSLRRIEDGFDIAENNGAIEKWKTNRHRWSSPYGDADWLHCRDGKYRPVEPGTFPLAHGVSARVGRLRAYGNAIVPQVAAEFIRAYMTI